jgi:hypothetical protein
LPGVDGQAAAPFSIELTLDSAIFGVPDRLARTYRTVPEAEHRTAVQVLWQAS